jgi:hypothetical protein
MAQLAAYTYEDPHLAPSPVTDAELAELQASAMFDAADAAALRAAGEVLADQVEDVLDVWYGFVGANPHLLEAFHGPDGEPDSRYLEQVRGRFGRWILDTCNRSYDRTWLAYAAEIGRRHHRSGKNQADDVEATDHIPLRHIVALVYPITTTIRPFLEKNGHSREDVDAMHEAWRKSVILQVALWSRPYADGDW